MAASNERVGVREQLRALRLVVRGDPRAVRRPAIFNATGLITALTIVLANLVGAAVVTALIVLVLPVPDSVEGDDGLIVRNVVAAAAYTLLAIVYGVVRGGRLGRHVSVWLVEDRDPSEPERLASLRFPLRVLMLQTVLWSAAALLFAAVNVSASGTLALEVGTTVALGGVATASMAYLMQTRWQRAVVALALADVPPRRYGVPGVSTRATLTFLLTTGVPVLGMLLLGVAALLEPIDTDELARATIVLSGIALAVGLLATRMYARSIAAPLKTLRAALERVERGDFDATVPIEDATELGFVQSGFNRMVAGLDERERLRDLFGRHVGEDVAQRALQEGVTLGGEEREAAALFVDVVGSTRFAATRPPGEVVAALNAFFAVVVDVTRAHGGLVNKFEGDAALCVFGAPLALDDPAGAALAAARALAARLDTEVDVVQAAVGVSAGTVVAGNIGAADRFEYTVIGDPVNEAARLTELAKEQPGGLVASEAAVSRAAPAERARWRLLEPVVLRGRVAPTRPAVPFED